MLDTNDSSVQAMFDVIPRKIIRDRFPVNLQYFREDAEQDTAGDELYWLLESKTNGLYFFDFNNRQTFELAQHRKHSYKNLRHNPQNNTKANQQ